MLIQSDRKQVRWPDWFAENGLSGTARWQSGMRFDRSFLAIAAAADGLGVALESTRLAERELAAGRLVAPFARAAPATSATPATTSSTRRPGRSGARCGVFAEWLSGELGIRVGAG